MAKKQSLEDMTLSQLQIAALRAFPSSPTQRAIRAEINKRHARGERTWLPPVTNKNPPLAFGGGSHKNTGTFIDGAFGQDHAVAVMAGLLRRVLRVADDAEAEKLLNDSPDPDGDDREYFDEWLDDATDVLQQHTGGGLVWVWEAGDLILMDEDEAE